MRDDSPPLPPRARALTFGLAATLVLLAVSQPINDPDTWQHLRVGQVIWQQHAVPHLNVWTWPTLGAPYDVPSWLFRALLWPFWQALGVPGLFLWRWVTALALVGLLYRAALGASRARGDGLIALAVILWGMLFWRHRWQCRPETLASLLLAAELWLLESRRGRPAPASLLADRAWLLVPILILWINTHLSYHLGLVVAGGFVLDGLWRSNRGDRTAAPGRLAVITAGAFAACFFNPNGWRAVWQPFHFFLHERRDLVLRVVDELQPIDWSRNLWNGLALYLALMLALAVWRWRRVGFDAAQAIILAVMLPQALATNRFLGLFAVATLPTFARDLEEALAHAAPGGLLRSARARALALTPVVALCLVDVARTVPPIGTAVHWVRLPVRACDFMVEHDVGGRGYNMFWHGGYLLWRFWPRPDRLPFMDIHQTGTREDRDLQVLALDDSRAWSRLDRRYRFDWVMLPTRPTTTQNLLDHLDVDTTRWALVFADDAASLFLRREGRSAALANRFGYRAVRLGNLQYVALGRRALADPRMRARLGPELDRAVGASPWNSRALSLRATIALAERRWADARQDLVAALEVDPMVERGFDRLAFALIMSGDPKRALEGIERARRYGMSDATTEGLARQAQAMIAQARGGRHRPKS